MNYQIIKRNTIAAIEQAVELAGQEGWIPQGGIAALRTANGTTTDYYQAMVRTTDSILSMAKFTADHYRAIVKEMAGEAEGQ